jgi:hypothetical protein
MGVSLSLTDSINIVANWSRIAPVFLRVHTCMCICIHIPVCCYESLQMDSLCFSKAKAAKPMKAMQSANTY